MSCPALGDKMARIEFMFIYLLSFHAAALFSTNAINVADSTIPEGIRSVVLRIAT